MAKRAPAPRWSSPPKRSNNCKPWLPPARPHYGKCNAPRFCWATAADRISARSAGRWASVAAWCVPSMGAVLKGFESPVCKPNMNSNEPGNISRSQGGPGDRSAERSLGKNREPMNKNRIEGRRDRASWHHTAKPFGWVSEVNAAVVRRRTAFLPGETCPVRAGQESAEAIVVDHEPGATNRPLKRSDRKSRDHEGLNR